MRNLNCTRCGRPLRSGASQARGMGPTCAAKSHQSIARVIHTWTKPTELMETLTVAELIEAAERDEPVWHQIEEEIRRLVGERLEAQKRRDKDADHNLTLEIWAAIDRQQALSWPLDPDRLSNARRTQARRERGETVDAELFA